MTNIRSSAFSVACFATFFLCLLNGSAWAVNAASAKDLLKSLEMERITWLGASRQLREIITDPAEIDKTLDCIDKVLAAQYTDAIAPLIEANLDAADIQGLYDFYTSPLGNKLVKTELYGFYKQSGLDAPFPIPYISWDDQRALDAFKLSKRYDAVARFEDLTRSAMYGKVLNVFNESVLRQCRIPATH